MATDCKEEKMVIHMNISAHQCLSMLLRPQSPFQKDWMGLADLMGFTYEQILCLKCDQDPVENIVRQWERKPDATVNTLISYLAELQRNDAIEDLQPFIDDTPFPSEHKKRAEEIKQQRPAEERLSPELECLTVSDEYYDGFICYAKEDRGVANEILQKLEGKPFFRKICIDYRDYVPGNCKLDQMAAIIEDRCKRIVVLLSRNFGNSKDAGFQVKIALNLSPDATERRVIPVKCEECDVPRILRHITYLDYVNHNIKNYFWKRLATSLGYKEPPTTKSSPTVDRGKTNKKKPSGRCFQW